MKNKALQNFQMGFKIKTAPELAYTPTQFSIWDKQSHLTDFTPTSALKYMNDALVGMNYHVLNQYQVATPAEKDFIQNYLQEFDPYHKLYQNSAQRLEKQIPKIPKKYNERTQQFEQSVSKMIAQFFSSTDLQFRFLGEILNTISNFEKETETAFIYNFNIQFSKSFTYQLTCFYSFLFHLRTITGLYLNSQVEDSVFEGVKCDSISDYLSKTDFTVNDALLYWQFKKLATPFVGQPDVRVEKLFVNPLESAFLKYNHNACSLINNLPESYLTFYSTVQLEEHLHQIQADWLLGSSCGLLFRIREELYGIHQGYNQIFWPEVQPLAEKNTPLYFCFEITPADLQIEKTAV